MKKLLAALALLVVVATAGCSSGNSLVFVVDGKVYQRELPKVVEFPMTIEALPPLSAELTEEVQEKVSQNPAAILAVGGM